MIAGDFLDRIRVRFNPKKVHTHYQAVFDSPSGRIVLADLARKVGFMRTQQGWNSEQLQYVTGRIDLFKIILGMLRIRPQDVQQISEMEAIDE